MVEGDGDAAPRAFASGDADADAVLAAFRRHGPDFALHVPGDVAYAVWDPATATLHAGSDVGGALPVFHATTATGVAVGTDPDALAGLPGVGDAPDDVAVVSWLLEVGLPPQATFRRAVRRIPGGYRLQWRRGQGTVTRWWHPDPPDPSLRTTADFVARYRDVFTAAVRDQLVRPRVGSGSDPVTLHLSGGFDSTAIACVAGKLVSEPGMPALRTVSGVYPGFAADESARIAVARAACGLPGELVTCGVIPFDRAAMLDQIRARRAPVLDEQHGSEVITLAVVRGTGSSVLIGGYGGDEVLYDFRPPTTWRQRAPELGRRLTRTWLRHALGVGSGPFRHLLEPPYWALARELLANWRPPTDHFTMATDVETQWRRSWLVRLYAAHGVQLRMPYLDRRVIGLIVGADGALRPRPTPDAPFKPLVARAFGDLVPAALTGAWWKAEFDGYASAQLAASFAHVRAALAEPLDPRALTYVGSRRVRALVARSELTDPRPTRKTELELMNVLALHLWLAGR